MKQLKLIIAALFLISPFAANADLLVNGDGFLTGLTDVNVNGTLYNVVFADGTCIDIFSGCDEASDFAFNNGVDAAAASAALLDLIVDSGLGNFDSQPDLTIGCPALGQFDGQLEGCGLTTVYGFADSGNLLVSWFDNWTDDAVNTNPSFVDAAYDFGEWVNINTGLGVGPDYDLARTNAGNAFYNIYAVWTPVPEPGTLALLGLGLAGMAARRRKV